MISDIQIQNEQSVIVQDLTKLYCSSVVENLVGITHLLLDSALASLEEYSLVTPERLQQSSLTYMQQSAMLALWMM